MSAVVEEFRLHVRRSKPVIVVEGPDGAGKSTLSVALAARLGAKLVHCGPYPGVSSGLPRLYVEAMLPALQGYQPVVLDRSWLSEPIYASVRRDGDDRIGCAAARMLARLVLRCGGLAVLCLPPADRCVETYLNRKGQEYLADVAQVKAVHAEYAMWGARFRDLPLTRYDYATERFDNPASSAVMYREPSEVVDALVTMLGPSIPVAIPAAGRLDAPVMLVGEGFAAHKNHDPLAQYPFVSFSRGGCSAWLAENLEAARVPERDLLWVNADIGDELLARLANQAPRKLVAALGVLADEALKRAGVAAASLPHPQHAKRFNYSAGYELGALVERSLRT